MSLRTRFSFVVGLLAMSLAPLTGCGGADCGEGTFEEDGVCMPEIAADEACGSGTMLVDGQCVLDESGCGTDAVLDTESGQCEPAPDFCADGTTYDQGTDKCIANTEVVCGTNTVANEDGICEPAVDQICGDKTTADENGRCVIAADACASGEVLDPNSGDCVATDTYCSDTTAFDSDSGTCVPTADVCDTGTEFDDESGLCLPDACQTGDVLLNGVCVSPAEALADEADASSSENDDPSLGGTAVELTVEPVGDSAVFTGTIDEPSDINGDNALNQDADVFSFDATAGQWFNLSVQSTGLPAPAFMVEGPQDYVRYSGFGMAAARKIVIPRDGTYTITVLPETVLQSEGDVGPAGSPEWSYVGSLEQVDAPSPSTVDISANDLTGSFADLNDNLFSIDGVSAGDLVDVSVDTAGNDAEGVFQVWAAGDDFRSATDIASGDELTVVAPDTGTMLVLVDWKKATGPNLDFGISAEVNSNFEGLGNIGADSSATSSEATIADGDTQTYTFSVGAGQVIEISQDNGDPSTGDPTNEANEEVDLVLSDSAGSELLARSNFDDVDDSSADYMYWYTETGGTFILESTADADIDFATVTVNSTTPNDLGAVGISDSIDTTVSSTLEQNRSEFHLLTVNEAVQTNGSFEANGGNALFVALQGTDNSVIDAFGPAAPVQINDVNIAPAGMYLVRVTADDSGVTEYTVDLTFSEAPQLEVEPNDTIQDASPYDPTEGPLEGTSADGSDVDVYSFSPANDLAADEVFVLDMRQTNTATDEYVCRLEDSSGNVLHDNGTDGIENGCTMLASGLLASNTYYFFIERETSSDSEDYTIESRVETGSVEVEPNEDQAAATSITFADLLSGTSAYGRLMDDPDTDYFTFNLASDRDSDEVVSFDVSLLGPDSVTESNVEIELISAANGSVASGDISSTLTATGLTAGDYFIRLERTGGSSWNSSVYALSASAVVPVCGNGTVEPGETCDDGNTATGDGCDDTCAIEPDVCGNTIVETGEECDAGPNGSTYCSASCTINTPTTSQTSSPAAAIPTDGSQYNDSVSISGCTTIEFVTLDVDITHPFRGDLEMFLEGPSGTSVQLTAGSFGNSTPDYVGTFPTDFSPVGSFDDFVGETGDGSWTLVIEDTFPASDDGTLNSWGVNLWCN